MAINYQKQHALGIAGLALLRNWLIGKEASIVQILKEISDIFAAPNNNTDANRKKAIGFKVKDGYKIWAANYDKNKNLLIEVEEPVVKSILDKLTPGSALDAACGTGRYSLILKNLGYNVTGIDFSPEMLEVAKKQIKDVRFIESDLSKIPLKSESFGLVLCGLGLNQIKDIGKPIKEFARVVKPGGRIIISSIHPVLIALGSHAEFPDKKGNLGYIKDTAHWPSEYIHAFNQSGLRIIQCKEPKMETKHIETAQTVINLSKETVSKALIGLPVAIVWELEKLEQV